LLTRRPKTCSLVALITSYDSLTQPAINLLMELQIEYEFRDQLVPMAGGSDDDE
jgi:hypothetical protein